MGGLYPASTTHVRNNHQPTIVTMIQPTDSARLMITGYSSLMCCGERSMIGTPFIDERSVIAIVILCFFVHHPVNGRDPRSTHVL